MTNNKRVDIGTDRQLFLDDFWIDGSSNVTRILHSPTRRDPVIEKEYPWEEGHVGGMTTAFDGEKYRMWYKCEDARVIGVAGVNFHRMAYAESEDGINWTKPFLRQEKFQGSMENNLFSPVPGVPNIDANPDAKEHERFKGFKVIGRREKSAIYAMASPDGIRWHQMRDEPILTGWPFDTKNLFFWDKWTGQYRGYTRGIAGNDPNVDPATVKTIKGHEFIGGVRWIRTTTSEDFLNWTPFQDIDAGDTPLEHLYTNECWAYDRAPNTYLMFPSRYVAHRMPDPDWYDGTGVNDIAFMSSRDGVNFDRSFMEAFLRPGLDQRNWHERGIYFQHGIYQTSPTELSMYVGEHMKTPRTHIRRYTLRPDGFVSVNAGYAGGAFTTQSFIFDGNKLELNYSTSAVGTVQVEIQDDRGNAVPGFALDDCPEIFGDQIEGVVRWNSGGDVSRLAGKPVKLRFAINDADIFAFRFR